MPFIQMRALWRYAIYLIILSGVAFFLLIFLSHMSFIREVVSGRTGLPGTGITLLANAWYWSLKDLSPFQLVINILAALLFGMNLMSILYFARIYKATFASAVSLLSIGAFTTALIGLLCISCGSFLAILIPSLFSILFLSLLPFHGLEFSVLSIMLLSASLWFSYKKLLLSGRKH